MADGPDAKPLQPLLNARLTAVSRFLYILVLVGVLLVGWRLYGPVLSIAANVEAATEQSALAVSELRMAAAEARGAIAQLSGKHGVGELLRNANVVTAQVGRTTNTVRLAAVEQRAQAKASAVELTAALGELRQMVGSTNNSLNGDKGALRTLTVDLEKAGAAIDGLSGVAGLVAEGTKTLASAGAAVEELRPELQRATKGLADTTEHANGAVANVEATTGYIKQSFAPKKLNFWGRVAAVVVPAALNSVISLLLPQRVVVTNNEEKK